MTKSQIFDQIETGAVLNDLLLASSPASLIGRMERNFTLSIEATEMFKNDPEFRRETLARAKRVFAEVPEPGYAHPKRTALGAYLYLIFTVPDPECRLFMVNVGNANRRDLVLVTEVAQMFTTMLTDTTISVEATAPDFSEAVSLSWLTVGNETINGSDPSGVTGWNKPKEYALAA